MTNIEKQQFMIARFKRAVKYCERNKVTYNPITQLYDLIFYYHSKIKFKFCFKTEQSAERFRYTLLH